MPNDLEKRYFEYLSGLPDSENIDDLDIPKERFNSKKADYFIFKRNVICEVKTLKTDTEHKINDEIDKHREREEFPLIFGEVELKKLLAHLPDGEKINATIFEKITRSTEQALRSADKQISDTKKSFCVNNVIGLLVILNESIEVLSPEVITLKVSRMLTQETQAGSLRYNNITSVWVINESHFINIENKTKGTPSIIIDGPNAERIDNIENIFTYLQEGWAKFNNSPLFYSDEKIINNLNFQSNSEANCCRSPTNLKPRHEIWRDHYRKEPYLRKLEDNDLLKYGVNLMNEITPYFLKGGPDPTQEHYDKYGTLFTHFMEEMSFRGLDWREIQKNITRQ